MWWLLAGLLVAAFALAWSLRDPGRARPARLYPYQALIDRHARDFGLDPPLVAAVIDNESGFDPRKRSPDGAVGLMQVMPETGRLAARALGIEDYDDADLWDPDVNVRVGCWYLGTLLERFDGDLVAALAAYNAGPARIEAWRQTVRWRERRGIERIPVMETRSYVLLVLREYEAYRRRAARQGG